MKNNNENSWEAQFDDDFRYLGEDSYDLNRKGIKAFIHKVRDNAVVEERERIIKGIEKMRDNCTECTYAGNDNINRKNVLDLITQKE